MANSPCISSQVAILLCTYNGERYLKEQLDSVLRQTYSDWIIYASDDGSTDSTLRILQSYKDRLGARLVIFRGPGQGFSANFLSLVNSSDVAAAYYAFCDQDDVWHPDKLERGIGQLQALGEGVASLYCSRTRLVSSDGQEIGFSPCFERPASFRNALVQSLAGANTMVFNDLARGIIRKVPPATRVVSHDWLAYLLISGVGGGVFYDRAAKIDYRQHGGNVIGANTRIVDRWVRLQGMLNGKLLRWNQQNIDAVEYVYESLTAENRRVFDCFVRVRKSGFLERLVLLWKGGFYRQTWLGHAGLWVAAALGKI